MRSKVGPLAMTTGLVLLTIPAAGAEFGARLVVDSPGKVLRVAFELQNGVPTYQVTRLSQPVIASSRLGFQLKDGPSLDGGFHVVASRTSSFDETWTQVWGEQKDIRDHHNELQIDLAKAEGPGRLTVIFRVFDDGVGLRYVIPDQPGLSDVEITAECTEFAMTGDHRTWWIPAFQPNRYEYRYTDSPLSATTQVHTPVTCATADGLYLSIHEAALVDFPSMALSRREGNTLTATLYPWSDGIKARGRVPLVSPWRTLEIADSPGGLIENYLILNLNEPNQLDDVSWIKPGKFVGIWWEMHLEKSTWHSGPKHGATTENTKRYIDFAADNGLSGVLVEGWNEGWDGEWWNGATHFNFTKPYPDFDLPGLADYARSRGVRLIGHHETGGGVEAYERQLEDAYALCEKLGIHTVKTGYVAYGTGITRTDAEGRPQKEWHHGQYMVRHYRKVMETAARHHVMLDVHEPIKDTGLRRTFPNLMTSEGACGQEYDAWGGERGNLPDHTTILPFTRLLAGPMDYTPGIFAVRYDDLKPGNRVRTTVAKQLALYVVIYSPLQMAADLPENYAARPEPFAFIKAVPTDWEFTKVLDAAIGDYVTIARKDRNSDDWYVGSITDENGRSLAIDLDFLDADRSYVAEIYRDGPGADWDKNPYPVDIVRQPVTAKTTLKLRLAPGGGTAIRLHAAPPADVAATQ
ncbi:MAG TPA: glycoside hydrolase family 97 protein [Phycisphaerae bacterium]|nr:glycoside hydrolase family 97 protein [Phycisphaerae bacterium]